MSIASMLVPDAIRRRYALKFAIVLLLLGLSVAGVAVVGTNALAEDVEDRVQGNQEAIAEHEARNIEQWNQRNFFFTAQTATSVNDAGDAEAVFQGAMEEEPGLHSLHHVDMENGVILESTNDELDGQPITEVDEVWPASKVAIESQGRSGGQEFFGTPVPGTAHDGTPVLFYGRFVGEGSDELVISVFDMSEYADEMISPEGSVGYVVADTSSILDTQAQFVFSQAESQGLIDGDEVILRGDWMVVMDESGQSFFETYETYNRPNGEPLETNNTHQRGLYHSGVPPGPELQASTQDQYNDDDFLVTSASITEETNFYVMMHTPESEGLVFASTVQEQGLLVGVIALLLVFVVGGVLGRNTSASINRLTEKAQQMEEGDLQVEFETQRIDSIGQLYGGFASMRDSLAEQIQNAERARQDAEEARAETERINEQLEADADHFREVLQRYAAGDLTVRMEPDSDHEVMNDIAAEFNDSVAEIEQTVAELSDFADEVATASEEVTASSEEVRSASQQVSDSVQQISDGAARQNQTLQTVDQEMEGLSTTVEQIAASSNEVADIAARTAETGRQGSEAAQEAMRSFERLEEERQAVVEEFERLRAEVSQIDELTDTIADIAEQTNMLALNANIEASRSESGDDGGFGVVAQEVKELSTDAKEAADEIGDRLERIQEQTERSAEEVDNTSDEFDRVAEQVREAVQALDEIADFAKETNTGVQEISAATEQQAAATQEVVAMVDEAATISEETTTEAENVAAAAEEQTTAMTEVSNSASSLTQQASRLSEALDRFEVDADDASLGVANEIDDQEIDGSGQHQPDERQAGDQQSDEQQDDEKELDGAVQESGDEDGSDAAEFEADGSGESDDDETVDPEDVFTFGDDR